MQTSVRSQRLLRDLGVSRAFSQGDRFLLLGPEYALRREPDTRVRMIFLRGEAKEILVGYASNEGSGWSVVESEPYTMTSYGYYERRLKRIGDWVVTPPAEGLLEL